MSKLETVTVDDVAAEVGITPHSADNLLRRLGVDPVSREAGRRGRNLYSAKRVRKALDARPGRGARTDLIGR